MTLTGDMTSAAGGVGGTIEAFFARGRLGVGVTCVAETAAVLANDGVELTTAGADFVTAGADVVAAGAVAAAAGIFATTALLDLAGAGVLDLAARGTSEIATAAGVDLETVAEVETVAGVDVAEAGGATLMLGGSVGLVTTAAVTSRAGAGRNRATVSAGFVGKRSADDGAWANINVSSRSFACSCLTSSAYDP